MFLAQIVKELGLSNLMTGYAAAIPYIVGTIGMVVLGYITDRTRERRWNCFVACMIAVAGLAIAGLRTAPGGRWSACRSRRSGSTA